MNTLKKFFKSDLWNIREDSHDLRALDERDIYRYRKQRGVNLGSWFVLERWICETPFVKATGSASSDYDVACGDNAKEILEAHWDTWIVDEDWKWICERGFNSVRLPIGYYHLVAKDPSVVNGTPFAKVGHVFEGAWERIIKAVETASRYGIGVMLDLHSAPGKQNADSHSGINGKVEFYKRANLSRTIHVLNVLATTFAQTPNVIGIEVVNEPQFHESLASWYNSALDSVRAAVGPDIPLYIHDAWDTSRYASVVHRRSDFVVLDHHLYRCFTSQDHSLSGDQHAAAMPYKAFSQHSEMTRGNFVVAEFSAALNPKSYGGALDAGEQDRQRRVFARAELKLFEDTCAGWWLWTYKKDGWDAGWNVRDAVRAEIIPDWVGYRRETCHSVIPDQFDKLSSDALTQHSNYWATQKGKYEHWRFEAGFKQGWSDAVLFFQFNPPSACPTSVSELGFEGQWLLRRTREHIASGENSKNIWEFEHGFRQGYRAAHKAFLE